MGRMWACGCRVLSRWVCAVNKRLTAALSPLLDYACAALPAYGWEPDRCGGVVRS